MEDAAHKACQRLSEMLAARAAAGPEADALTYFLKIHTCICKRVEKSRYPQMWALNEVFAMKCVEVYENFDKHKSRPSELHTLWITAFAHYLRDKSAVMQTLAVMAAAHILIDLEAALFEVNVQDKNQFDEVFQDVVCCLDETTVTFAVGTSLTEMLLRFFSENFKHGRDAVIWEMRDFAWGRYQDRKLVSRGS